MVVDRKYEPRQATFYVYFIITAVKTGNRSRVNRLVLERKFESIYQSELGTCGGLQHTPSYRVKTCVPAVGSLHRLSYIENIVHGWRVTCRRLGPGACRGASSAPAAAGRPAPGTPALQSVRARTTRCRPNPTSVLALHIFKLLIYLYVRPI